MTDKATFFMGLSSDANDVDQNVENDVKEIAKSIGYLIPTFETVEALLAAKRPDVAREELTLAQVTVKHEEYSAPPFFVASRRSQSAARQVEALRLELTMFAGVPTFETSAELFATAEARPELLDGGVPFAVQVDVEIVDDAAVTQ